VSQSRVPLFPLLPSHIILISYRLASAFQDLGHFLRSASGKLLSGIWLPIMVQFDAIGSP